MDKGNRIASCDSQKVMLAGQIKKKKLKKIHSGAGLKNSTVQEEPLKLLLLSSNFQTVFSLLNKIGSPMISDCDDPFLFHIGKHYRLSNLQQNL